MTSAVVTVRLAKPDDSETIAALVAELTTEICERSGSPPFDLDVSATSATCRRLIESGDYLALLAFVESDAAVGVATISEGSALYVGGALATFQEFYVAQEWRSRGVGESLAKRIVEIGSERSWNAIELCTPPLPAFERTVTFYERCGFAVSGGRKMRLWL